MPELEAWVPIAFFEIGVSAIIIFLGILMIKKYMERKNKTTLILSISFIMFAISPLMDPIDPFFINRDARLGEGLAFMFLCLAMLFLTIFTYDLFKPNEKKTPKKIAIYWVILAPLLAVMGFLSTQDLLNNPFSSSSSINMIIYQVLLLPLLIGIYIVFIILARFSFNASAEATSISSKRGFQLILSFSIGMIILFSLILTDLLLGQYTILLYIGWSIAVLSALLGYLGFIMPSWLKKMVEK